MNQNIITVIVGFICMLVPISFLWAAVAKTPKHAFACPNCDADIPPGNARCPNCGAPVQDADQPL